MSQTDAIVAPITTAAAASSTTAAPSPKTLVAVMIPTFNEADHIADAVANALQLGPVFVLDSLSTDGTQDLARRAGATVVEHAFVNYSHQKNWGLDHLPFTSEWVFILDADERLTPPLRDEVLRRLSRRPATDGYYVNRALIFMGRLIRHGGLYPSWNLRLMRLGRARYEQRSVHEHVVCDGPTDYLRGQMLHVRRETMSYFLDKHIRYADMESDEWIQSRSGLSRTAPPDALFKDPASILRIRQWLRRQVWPRVPARPLWRFIYMYFLRLGLLDGEPGWHLALLMACYEYMITLFYRQKLQKVREANGSAKTPA